MRNLVEPLALMVIPAAVDNLLTIALPVHRGLQGPSSTRFADGGDRDRPAPSRRTARSRPERLGRELSAGGVSRRTAVGPTGPVVPDAAPRSPPSSCSPRGW